MPLPKMRGTNTTYHTLLPDTLCQYRCQLSRPLRPKARWLALHIGSPTCIGCDFVRDGRTIPLAPICGCSAASLVIAAAAPSSLLLNVHKQPTWRKSHRNLQLLLHLILSDFSGRKKENLSSPSPSPRPSRWPPWPPGQRGPDGLVPGYM
jgi:hypothetical protein